MRTWTAKVIQEQGEFPVMLRAGPAAPKGPHNSVDVFCDIAETGMLLVAFKVAELTGFLCAMVLAMVMALVPVTHSWVKPTIGKAMVEKRRVGAASAAFGCGAPSYWQPGRLWLQA